MKNKIYFLLSVIIVALIALVLMPAIGRLLAKSDSEPILKDVSIFKNKIADTNKRELPPPEQLTGCGVRIFNADGTYVAGSSLTYEGKPLMFYVSIANAMPDKDKFGLMVFADSEIISYNVDGKKAPEYFYTRELPGFSLANIPITIKLDKSMSNGNHKIYFTFINKLDEKRDENNSSLVNPLSIFKNVLNNNSISGSTEISSIKSTGTVIPVRSDITPNTGFRMAIDFDSDIKDLYQKGKLTVKSGDVAKLIQVAQGCLY
jgi:hypothetical protein